VSNTEQLERVEASIGGIVHAFLQGRLSSGDPTFRAVELRDVVARSTTTSAPASADRVLRELRLKGVVDYTVVDRAGSLYRVERA